MATNQLSVSAAWVPTNQLQPVETFPAPNQQPAMDLLSTLVLMTAGAAPFASAGTLAVPSNATTGATTMAIVNTDSLNYLFVTVPNVAASAAVQFVLAPGMFMLVPQYPPALTPVGTLATSPANLSAITAQSVLSTGLASSTVCAYSLYSTAY